MLANDNAVYRLFLACFSFLLEGVKVSSGEKTATKKL